MKGDEAATWLAKEPATGWAYVVARIHDGESRTA